MPFICQFNISVFWEDVIIVINKKYKFTGFSFLPFNIQFKS